LPAAERPPRTAAFDALFVEGLRAQARISATTLRWEFDPAAVPEARRLAALEAACCSFFTFDFDGSTVDVTVPAERSAVLDALQARAGR